MLLVIDSSCGSVSLTRSTSNGVITCIHERGACQCHSSGKARQLSRASMGAVALSVACLLGKLLGCYALESVCIALNLS